MFHVKHSDQAVQFATWRAQRGSIRHESSSRGNFDGSERSTMRSGMFHVKHSAAGRFVPIASATSALSSNRSANLLPTTYSTRMFHVKHSERPISTILPSIPPQMFHVKHSAEQSATHPATQTVLTITTTGGPSEAESASLAAVTTIARAAGGRAN